MHLSFCISYEKSIWDSELPRHSLFGEAVSVLTGDERGVLPP